MRPQWVESLESRLLLAAVTYTGTVNGSWNNAANWSTGIVPLAGDDVVIDQPGNIQGDIDGQCLRQQRCDHRRLAHILQSGAALTTMAGLTNNGDIIASPTSVISAGRLYNRSPWRQAGYTAWRARSGTGDFGVVAQCQRAVSLAGTLTSELVNGYSPSRPTISLFRSRSPVKPAVFATTQLPSGTGFQFQSRGHFHQRRLQRFIPTTPPNYDR